MTITKDTFTLLGASVYLCQQIEFGLYGIASHVSHLPEAQKDRRFATLTPEAFLSNDPKDEKSRKATFGQIAEVFGNRFLLSGPELDALIKDRNLIVHEFWRSTRPMRGVTRLENPDAFLIGFISRATTYLKATRGLLSHMINGAAAREDRLAEIEDTEQDAEDRTVYESIVRKHFTAGSAHEVQPAVQANGPDSEL